MLIPFIEGGLKMRVEIKEGETKFPWAMMSLQDLGFWESKVSKCRKLSMQTLVNTSLLEEALGVCDAKEEEE